MWCTKYDLQMALVASRLAWSPVVCSKDTNLSKKHFNETWKSVMETRNREQCHHSKGCALLHQSMHFKRNFLLWRHMVSVSNLHCTFQFHQHLANSLSVFACKCVFTPIFNLLSSESANDILNLYFFSQWFGLVIEEIQSEHQTNQNVSLQKKYHNFHSAYWPNVSEVWATKENTGRRFCLLSTGKRSIYIHFMTSC